MMQRGFLTILAGILLATGPAAAQTDTEIANVRKVVTEKFPGVRPEDVKPSQTDGWYVIQKGAIIAYVSADGRYLMQGELIDLENDKNLTEESRNGVRKEIMAAYPEDQMIVFSPEEKLYSISVFTDIDCTFCRRLHSQMDEYLAQGIEVRYLLYPRNGPTSPSWAKAEEVWCADDRGAALTSAKLGEGFDSHSCNPAEISKHYALGQDVGLTGTPALVFEDGTLVSGYMPPDQLVQVLASGETR